MLNLIDEDGVNRVIEKAQTEVYNGVAREEKVCPYILLLVSLIL